MKKVLQEIKKYNHSLREGHLKEQGFIEYMHSSGATAWSKSNLCEYSDNWEEIPDCCCPHCDVPLESKMFDIDGTNLEEHSVCPECGYGTPALI